LFIYQLLDFALKKMLLQKTGVPLCGLSKQQAADLAGVPS
jgi:hypothetical protein